MINHTYWKSHKLEMKDIYIQNYLTRRNIIKKKKKVKEKKAV